MTFARYIVKTVPIIILTFFLHSKVFGREAKDYENNPAIICFFKNLYNFSFNKADSVLLELKKSGIDKAAICNLSANLYWWKLLSGDSVDQNLKSCNENIDESINLLLKTRLQESNSLLNIIYSYSLKARVENYRGNTFRSFISFYKSSVYIKKCMDSPILDEKLALMAGLYLYFKDYFEDEYFILLSSGGDRAKGLKYLEECTSSSSEMIRTEANYFLLKIYGYTEKDYLKAYLKSKVLTEMHPNNFVYSMENLRFLMLLNKSGEAQLYQTKLVGEIMGADGLNLLQRNHFISQIEELSKTTSKF